MAVALVALAMAAPARADEPSPDAIALAASILTDVGVNNSVAAIVPITLRELERNIAAIHPEMQTALAEASVAILPEFAKSDEKVLGDLAHVFAARMTEQELRDTKAFFESPVGQKVPRIAAGDPPGARRRHQRLAPPALDRSSRSPARRNEEEGLRVLMNRRRAVTR